MSEIGIVSRISTFSGITFVVNTAVDQVSLILTGTPNLSVNGAIQNLQYGDQCIIEGFALCLPFQFGQGQINSTVDGNPAFFQLGWRDLSAHTGSVSEVGDTGRINIPDFNTWYDTYAFVPQPSAVDSKWQFEIVGLGGRVSMFNVPAALDTDTLNCCIHLRIRHTLILIA